MDSTVRHARDSKRRKSVNSNIILEMIHVSEKVKCEISIIFLSSLLFISNSKLAIDFLEILIVYVLSLKVTKDHFSHLVIKLSKQGKERICEYTLGAVFTIFVFVEMEFLLNRLYILAFSNFVVLLFFTAIALYFIVRGEALQA